MKYALIVLLAACAHAGSDAPSAPLVPLDRPPPAEPTTATAPTIEEVTGAAPASAPVGEPIAITFVAPKVGDTRNRSLHMHEVYDTKIDTKVRHQDSDHTYSMQEQVTAIDGDHVKTMRTTVRGAHEHMVLDGEPHDDEILGGTYLVDVGGGLQMHGSMSATKEGGGDANSREQEELGMLFSMDAGGENPIVKIVREHPLRLHESIALSDEEKQLYAGGQAIAEPIGLTLVEATGGMATYEVDVTRTDTMSGMTVTLKLRERSRFRIATGALVETVTVTNKTERSDGMSQDARARMELSFSLVPR
jgi:hypothetical protein